MALDFNGPYGPNDNTNTMKKFKYALAIRGTEEEQMALIPKLEKLGYRQSSSRNAMRRMPIWGDELVTNYGDNKGEYGLAKQKGDRIDLPASNPDLVLALAAMVDDEEPHEGEIWTYDYVEKNCYRVHLVEGHVNLDYLSTSGDNMPYKSLYEFKQVTAFRKATKEEIISHFNKTNMTITPTMTTNGQEPIYSVSGSFIKEAHEAASDQWKRKIEQQFPTLFPKPFKVGEMIEFNNQQYIIAGGEGRAILVDVKTGLVRQETTAVSDLNRITYEELLDMGAAYGLTKQTLIKRS